MSTATLVEEPEAHQEHSAGRSATIVVSVCGVSFLNSFFSGAVTASLPTIQKDLDISNSNLPWSVTLYSLILGAASPPHPPIPLQPLTLPQFLLPAGRLADVYTPRRLFLLGTAFYCALSIAVALSPNWQAFTAFCSLLGLGAAANTPAGVGVLGAYFEAGEAKNRAFASLGAGQPLGFICGLVIGALLTQTQLGWRASFYVQAGLALLFAILGYFTIPSSFPLHPSSIPLTLIDNDGASIKSTIDPSLNRRVDWIGTALSVSGLVLLTFSLADAQSEPKGWATAFILPLLILSLAIITAFFFWERRLDRSLSAYYAKTDHAPGSRPPPPPLLTPSIWRAPHLGWILAIVFFAWAGFNTASYYINFILQLVVEVSPIKTALYFLPMIVSGVVLNLIPGFLLGRVNGKTLLVLSMSLSLIGPILMAVMDTTAGYWFFIFPIMIFLPAPDLSYAIATVQISKSVSRSEQATAGALFNVITRLATAISLSLISTAANSISDRALSRSSSSSSLTLSSPEVLMEGYRVAAWLCTGCVGLALGCCVGLGRVGVVGRKEEEGEVVRGGEEVGEGGVRRRRRG